MERVVIKQVEQSISVKNIEDKIYVEQRETRIVIKDVEQVKVFQEGVNILRTALTVQSNGQTQFNIFSNPTGQHWLIVNGLEEYPTKSYNIQNIGGNWRLVWLNTAYQLRVGMEVIFVTQNI